MATLMEWKYGHGFDPAEFCTAISFSANTELKETEKDLFVSATATASSKTLTLGLPAGQTMILSNVGSNTFTVKNVSGDSGTSLATGKVALIIASQTANATKVYVLN